jgi:hypothetical protein
LIFGFFKFKNFSDSSTEPFENDKDDINSYIKHRFEKSKKYYKSKADQYRGFYFILQALIIISGAIIPIINSTSNTFNLSSILGVIIVIFSALLQLVKAQEFWTLYASALDQLEKEYELFLHRIDEYSNDDKRNKNFVNKIESIIESKSNKYMFFRQADKDTRGGLINLLNEMLTNKEISKDEFDILYKKLEHRL